MAWKKFLQKWGVWFVLGYILGYAVLISFFKIFPPKGALPGDFIYINEVKDSVFYMPFVSSALFSLVTIVVFSFFRLSRFFEHLH